jgi:hypothetical protein
MSRFVLNIRHRPQLGESISEKFEGLKHVLAKLPQPWGTGAGIAIDLPPVGTALSARIKLRGKLGRKISGELKLQLRVAGNLSDRAADDDALLLEFDEKDVDWKSLVDVAIPGYLDALDGYSLRLDRWEELPKKFEVWSRACRDSGKDLDGRDGPIQFGGVTYMDRVLCGRMANGLTPESVVEALHGAVEDVRILRGGVLIVAVDCFPDQARVVELDHEIRSLLQLQRWI